MKHLNLVKFKKHHNLVKFKKFHNNNNKYYKQIIKLILIEIYVVLMMNLNKIYMNNII